MKSGQPRLLVSVRNAEEAIAACLGGADIIDVKEPLNGSLGRASAEVMESIAASLADCAADRVPTASEAMMQEAVATKRPLSLALGEVDEWLGDSGSLSLQMQSVVASSRPRYLKLGLSGLCSQGLASEHSWKDDWKRVRAMLSGDHSWVAVAYADHQRAEAPDTFDVCAEAIESGCSVLLIDTFVKDGTTLLDWLPLPKLRELRVVTASANLQLALAGRVTERELPALLSLSPDIVAVRGAVCLGGDRTATVCSDRVKSMVTSLRDCSG